MIRTLNFTGRHRITREATRITLHEKSNGLVGFDAELTLGHLDLPADAKIYLEAAFKTTFIRFPWGTVGNINPPNERILTLEQPKLATFRIKIVEAIDNGLGRLLAVGDHIRPEGFQDGVRRRISLFRVNYSNELTKEIWRLSFDDDGPILDLNNMPGINDIVHQETFRALVYPELVRQILKAVLEEGINDEPDSWKVRWLRFAEKQTIEALPPFTDGELDIEHKEWINAVVEGFSKKFKLVENFKKQKQVGGVEPESV